MSHKFQSVTTERSRKGSYVATVTDERDDRCPPHNFHSAYVSDEKGGAIYCRWCGEIRVLEVPAVEAPAEERVNARTHDSGEG